MRLFRWRGRSARRPSGVRRTSTIGETRRGWGLDDRGQPQTAARAGRADRRSVTALGKRFPAMRLGSGGETTKALLVIDVQEGLFKRRSGIYREARLLENIGLLIGRAAEAGATIALIRHCDGSFLKQDTEDWQIHHAVIPPQDCLLVDKRHASCFRGTDLDARLEALGVTEVVMSGLVTQGCVRASCLDALARGYAVTLAADAHSSYHRDAASLITAWNARLANAGAILRETREISFE